MKFQLVIAEKPSVGMSIAKVLGANEHHEGYLEGNGYIVSWCFGHLAELVGAETYDERFAKWRKEDLPIVPPKWEYKISRDKFKQFEVLRGLSRRNDVEALINACDAGREGELIFRNVYQMTGCKKPILRLWISSMEDEAIRRGFEDLKPGTDYDLLYAAADCRAKADWLVGINATRLFSVLYHRTLNVGRVVSPTLALIVQRESEIEAFQPEPFYTVEASYDSLTATSERFKDKAEAESVCAACNGQPMTVKAVDAKSKTEKAPALYDLTTLQRDANRQLGYTAQQTLDYLQSLYEKKLVTYPRTDSRFLTDDMEESVKPVVQYCSAICGMEAPAVILTAQVCDSKKVSDHHAIIPTAVAGKTKLDTLPAGEREILILIARQVLMSVCEPYRYKETTVTLDCAGILFTAKGKSVTNAGWKAFSKQNSEEKALPVLQEWDVFPKVSAEIKEGKTTPPKHFTEDTLLSAMETAGAKDMPEDAERKGLGTPATRASMIEKLVETGFVVRQKAKKSVSLIPAQVGVSLITVLPEQLQSPLLTAEWEHKLKEVERGELAQDQFLKEINGMVQELIDGYTIIKDAEVLFPSGREVIGKCPRCGGDVTESKNGFFCEKNDCHFGLWRDNRFLSAKRINLTKKMATQLLKDGRVHVTGIYTEKSPRLYDADIVLEDNGERTMYRIDFGKGGRK